MKGEIDRDFYCSGDYVSNNGIADYCELRGGYIAVGVCKTCRFCKHKWPTPEQYKEEYGEEYPEDGAVWFFAAAGKNIGWWASEYKISREIGDKYPFVCACTPWGKPPANWRLE